jgi:glyoxylase-like metal-dependent hydrolase (beta-lactamase superfamily II)
MHFGQFDILTFVEHHMKLDGGSMYGVVPKSIWNKLTPADEFNLIGMVTNVFVLRAHDKRILIDTGLGDTLSEKEKKLYGTSDNSHMDSGLSSLGLTPDEIDFVVLSHLHLDHVGGAVRLVDGAFVPRFPNARYIVSRREWHDALYPNERSAAAYTAARCLALASADQVEYVEGETELLPGVTLVPTGGHTEGHLAVEMESEGRRVVHYADILPMRSLLRVAYIAPSDVFPLQTMDIKRRLLDSVVDTETVVALGHDPEMPLVRIRRDGGRLTANPVGT